MARSFVSARRKCRSKLKLFTGWPPMPALLDVALLIVMFVYVSKSFVKVYGISVDLPSAGETVAADLEKFIITAAPSKTVPGETDLYYQDDRTSFDKLPEQLSQLHGVSRYAAVIIRSDRRTSFEAVARIMAIAERAKVPCFIAVAPPEEKSAARLEQD